MIFETIPATLKWRNWLLLSLLVVFSGIFSPWRFVLGVAIGGIVVNLNFHFLHRTLANLLGGNGNSRGVVAKNLLRFLISGIVIAVVLKQNWVSVAGLFLGLSIVVINITVLALGQLKVLVLKS